MYNDIRARHVLNYDNFGYEPVGMEAVRRMHPNAKLADPTDGRSRMIKMCVVAAVFLIIGLLFLGFYISKDTAQVQHILVGNKSPESVLGIKSYNVIYKYSYEDSFYDGTDCLTLDQLHDIGLTNISSDMQGKIITTYADITNPKKSLLVK